MAEIEKPCPVCGAEKTGCGGHAVKGIIDLAGKPKPEPRVARVPRQHQTIGRAGYVGQVEEYEPKYPKIKMVPTEPDLVVSNESPKRKSKKKKGVAYDS